jgi:superfamily I DNA and/or RNA helicase/very-short-patch-repair endonuclease
MEKIEINATRNEIDLPKSVVVRLNSIRQDCSELASYCECLIKSKYDRENKDYWFNVSVWLKCVQKSIVIKSKFAELGINFDIPMAELDKNPHCIAAEIGLMFYANKVIERESSFLSTQMVLLSEKEWDKFKEEFVVKSLGSIFATIYEHCDSEWVDKMLPRNIRLITHQIDQQLTDNVLLRRKQQSCADSYPGPSKTVDNDSNFAFDSLQAIRNRLLDLTGRNRLLNFKHGRSGFVRVIDELPDQLAKELFEENLFMFIPVDEPSKKELIEAGYLELGEEGQEIRIKDNPTAQEWARYKGFDVSFELPFASESLAGNHDDNKIQSLFYPMELESKLRGIRSKANTAIEETGANILYFALGFLEWFEDEKSDISHLAPLYLIPVKIDKAKLDKSSGTYRYTIQYTGEDIVSNLSLREKLRYDFGLDLPEIKDNVTPESYLKLVAQRVLKNKPRWNIKRFGTLSLFDFGKLLMYLDLDPLRWPKGKTNIKYHPIIKKFFAKQGVQDDASSGFNIEYEIDELPDVHQHYPLIDDADSSQHSALVDGIKGENLVIEGPPGSGKSQTITNLIAAAISQGKKVLFVAEKMAALEVVKKRLHQAQLGDFCLELHSHKTQKSQVYQNLARRTAIQDSYRYPRQIDLDIAMYEEKKQQLNDYCELINSEWKKTGRTIHQIFTAATRYRNEYAHISSKEVMPEKIEGASYDEITNQRVIDELKRYTDVFEQIRKQIGLESNIEEHPWFGVYNDSIQHFDCDEMVDKLLYWQKSLLQLQNATTSFNQLIGDKAVLGLDDIKLVAQVRQQLPELTGRESLEALAQLQEEHISKLQEFMCLFESVLGEHVALKRQLEEELLSDEDLLSTSGQALSDAEYRLSGAPLRMSELYKLSESFEALTNQFNVIIENRAVVLEQIPALELFFPETVNGIEALAEFSEFVNGLDPTLVNRRNDCFDDERIDPHLELLATRLKRAKELMSELEGTFNLVELPTSKQLREAKQTLDKGGLFKWFKSDWKLARKNVLGLGTTEKAILKHFQPKLGTLLDYIEIVESINAEVECQKLLGNEFKGIDTNVGELLGLRRWYKVVRARYGTGFGKSVKLAELLFGLSTDTFKGLQHFANNTLTPNIESCLAQYDELKKYNFSLFKDKDFAIFGGKEGLDMQSGDFRTAVKSCQKCSIGDPLTQDLKVSLARAKSLLEDKKRLTQLSKELQTVFRSDEIPDLSSDPEPRLEIMAATLTVAKKLSTLPNQVIKTVLKQRISQSLLEECKQHIEKIENLYVQHLQAKQIFSDAVKLDESAWYLVSGGTLEGLVGKNAVAINQPDWLSTWVDFIRVRTSLSDKGLERLLRATESRKIILDELEGIYNYTVFDTLSREIINENQQLSHFSGANQNAIRHQFAEYDNKLKALQQEKIAYQASRVHLIDGISSGRVAGYTEMGLIRKEITKKARYISIRQLIARAPKSLQELKPCFMMGPHSVAQYLQPGKIDFDLVVMDEASQIKPQDSLGSIARGKQVIIVGDPKQLPPTSFFDKTIDNAEQDATAIELSESILDVAMPMFKARRLRWHYRSRHQSLIAFSNQEFYDSNLIIFPSPYSESDEFGIKFEYVARGRFVNQRNVEEAQIVAQSVRVHLLHRQKESLGVVAMSAQQREQIERCVEELSKEDEQFRVALEKNAFVEEPLFIKNLENVQGDERDVIFISCTYGPLEAGAVQMPQRFGPINSAAGGRRLNVLFTRSKKRMHVFSSMTEGHILAKDKSNPGVHAFKQFLAFAQTRNLYQPKVTGRIPDSDFEVAVASALKQEGFTCEPQVGIAGYYVDLAVLDPGMPGKYLMGIECDGATYHSAKSARDRDRLRQSVLENLGWKIYRIWSTDWFKNPQAQLKPIIEQLHQLKTVEAWIPEAPSEEAEVEELIATEELLLEVSDDFSHEAIPLKEKLQCFAEQVLDKDLPDIQEDSKLLRPAMIDALVEFRPVSKSEFQEFIPGYLRNNTNAQQGHYLDQVLNIIAEDERELGIQS